MNTFEFVLSATGLSLLWVFVRSDSKSYIWIITPRFVRVHFSAFDFLFVIIGPNLDERDHVKTRDKAQILLLIFMCRNLNRFLHLSSELSKIQLLKSYFSLKSSQSTELKSKKDHLKFWQFALSTYVGMYVEILAWSTADTIIISF